MFRAFDLTRSNEMKAPWLGVGCSEKMSVRAGCYHRLQVSTQMDSNDRVKSYAERLSGIDRSILAVCLFGSTSRGDANDRSDLDLLVVGRDPQSAPSRIRKLLPPAETPAHLSLQSYLEEDFADMFLKGTLFSVHLATEGRILVDPTGFVSRMFAIAELKLPALREELEGEMLALEALSKVERFGGNFLFGLADLYSVGKGIVMLALALRGVLEFNRQKAFERFTSEYPQLAPDASRIRELAVFHGVVTERRGRDELPETYRNREYMLDAVRAARHLGDGVLHDAR